MKKIFYIMTAAMLLCSCTSELDNRLKELQERTTKLEQTSQELNNSIEEAKKLIDAIQAHDLITGIQEVRNSDGTISYKISFLNSDTITLNQGSDGYTPIVGIGELDGKYYWTITDRNGKSGWLLINGKKVSASAYVPHFRIKNDMWEVSTDDTTWTKYYPAVGNEGRSVFQSITYNDETVTFILSDKSVLQVPTYENYQNAVRRCQEINDNLNAISTMLSSIDTGLAIESISHSISVIDNTDVYTLILSNGSTVKIGCGKSESAYYMGILTENGTDYWAIRYSPDQPYTILVDGSGNKVAVTSMSQTPSVGAELYQGEYYYVIKFSDSQEPIWFLDQDGNKVKISGFNGINLVDDVVAGTNSFEILLSDGTTVSVPFYQATLPEISFTMPEGITYTYNASTLTTQYNSIVADSTYTFSYSVANANASVAVDAVGMDGCQVVNVTQSAIFGNTITGQISFKTPITFNEEMDKSRIVVYLSWGSNTTMKVLEFKNQPLQ
ncbi:MAG: hypothetical protein HUJ90_03350 [Bacteroidales bacterium]|nr:hypothetical protein [Bacteroidales bacterium]